MPNLKGLIDGQYLNLAPDLYVRDAIDDDGSPRAGNATYASPDIITKQTRVANPGGQENNGGLSQPVLPGRDNFIDIRARNRGSRPTRGAFADVYWTEASTVLDPGQWNLVGRASFPSWVQAGNVLAVSNALRWQAPAGIKDPVLIVITGSEEDPAPVKPSVKFPTLVEMSRFFHQNNNVAARRASK